MPVKLDFNRPRIVGPVVRPIIGPALGQEKAGAPPSSLLNNLVAYWKLEESTGSRMDSTANAFNLTPAGTTLPGNAPGKIGHAVQLNSPTMQNQSLSVPYNSKFNIASTDFTMWCWVNFTLTGFPVIASRGGGANPFELYTDANGVLHFQCGSSFNLASPSGVIVASTWMFVVAWVDAVGLTGNVQVNNGTIYSASFTGSLTDTFTTQAFTIGSNGTGSFAIGLIDEFGYRASTPGNGGVLTSSQRTNAYNGGNGVTYPFTGVP